MYTWSIWVKYMYGFYYIFPCIVKAIRHGLFKCCALSNIKTAWIFQVNALYCFRFQTPVIRCISDHIGPYDSLANFAIHTLWHTAPSWCGHNSFVTSVWGGWVQSNVLYGQNNGITAPIAPRCHTYRHKQIYTDKILLAYTARNIDTHQSAMHTEILDIDL
jgi:hypothetical protein